MTTLEEFVRDGVVETATYPTSGQCHSIVVDSSEERVDMWADVGLSVETFDYQIVHSLTPTQLRALSAMSLWAAEQKEKKQ